MATSGPPVVIDVYPAKVALSVVVYCLSVSAVPIYNKEVFSGGVGARGIGLRKFPYPIATAFMQLGLVATALGAANVLGHLLSGRRREPGASWLFGPHFLYKLRHVAPVGLLFGFKYVLTNWGLQLVPTGTHLLLQSTDLVWTVAMARAWNKEKLGCVELVAALLVSIGSVMIGLHAGQILDAPALPLLVNCLTPLVLALCISTLRSGAKELFREDNRLHGSVTPAEFTSLKLFLSSLLALLLSLVMENGTVTWTKAHREAWWVALRHEQAAGVCFLLLGGVFVLIFQVNITWLAGLTSAVTVGIVGGIKVVPQWMLNAAFLGLRADMSPLNVGGAALVLSASCLYAFSISQPYTLTLGRHGLECRPRARGAGDEPLLAAEGVNAEPVGMHQPCDTSSRSIPKPSSSQDLLTPSSVLEVSVFLKEKDSSTAWPRRNVSW